MKQENNDLLLKYLCMALPYKVVIDYSYNAFEMRKGNYASCIKQGSKSLLDCDLLDIFISPRRNEEGEYIKPYLRPMSSMTEKRRKEYDILCSYNNNEQNAFILLKWLLEKHFDFMGLIPKGLAIEVTEENNPYKEE